MRRKFIGKYMAYFFGNLTKLNELSYNESHRLYPNYVYLGKRSQNKGIQSIFLGRRKQTLCEIAFFLENV